jgi:hypothetical protein
MVMKVSEIVDISIMKDHTMKTGIELQFLQLLRVSELLPTVSDHHFRGQDILFILEVLMETLYMFFLIRFQNINWKICYK